MFDEFPSYESLGPESEPPVRRQPSWLVECVRTDRVVPWTNDALIEVARLNRALAPIKRDGEITSTRLKTIAAEEDGLGYGDRKGQ